MFVYLHLGYCIGNQFEIEETIECLHGNLPADLKELITKYGIFQYSSLNNFNIFLKSLLFFFMISRRLFTAASKNGKYDERGSRSDSRKA